MLPNPQLRASMSIATHFLLPDASVYEVADRDEFEVTVGEKQCRISYRRLYAALDEGYLQFVEELKREFTILGMM